MTMRAWRILVLMVGAALVIAFAAPAFAGSDAKATGSVTWTSAGGLEGIYTEFALHDRDGDDVRGSSVYMTIPQDGWTEWRTIRVDCVEISGDVARWGGYITATNGSKLDAPIVGWVMDGGTPGANGDLIGTFANPPYGICGHSFTGGGTVTAGNLSVMP